MGDVAELRRVAGPPRRHAGGERRVHGRPLRAAPPRHGRARRRRGGRPTTTWPRWSASCARASKAGGFGFTSSWAISHNDANGDPVPSRHATPRGAGAPQRRRARLRGHQPRVHPDRRPLRRVALPADDRHVGRRQPAAQLEPHRGEPQPQADGGHGDAPRRRPTTPASAAAGCWPSPCRAPCSRGMSLESGFVFDMLNGWAKPMALPVEEKMALLADPDQRRELNDLAQGPSPMRGIAKWHKLTIGEVVRRRQHAVPGPHDRRDRRRRGPRDLRRAVRHRAGRRPAHRPVPAGDRRRRGDLAEARRGVARRAHAGRRHRRRCPPRPAGHLQRHHRHAGQGVPGDEAAAVRGGDQLHHRCAGPALRVEGPGPAGGRLPRRRRRGRPDDGRGPADRDPPRPSRRLVAPLRRGRRHRPRARERHRDRRPRPAHRRPPGSGDALGQDTGGTAIS